MSTDRALQIIGWTGGDKPAAVSQIGPVQHALVRRLFRSYCREWSGFWGQPVPLGTARTFWVWARYDAHATTR